LAVASPEVHSATASGFRLSGVHALLLGIHTSVLACLLAVLVARPDWIAMGLGKLAIRSAEQVAETGGQFYLDILILWAIGFACLALDSLSRNMTGSPLIASLFFHPRSGQRDPGRALRIATFVASFGVAPALVLIHLGRNPLGLQWLIAEDGPLENATVVGFAVAALLVGRAALRILLGQRQAPKWQGAVFLALSSSLLFVCMEEISWGQRVFGWETPASLGQLNSQDELNLHNIFTGYFEAAYLIVGFSLFGAACLSCWALLTRVPAGRLGEIVGILPDGSLFFLMALILLFSSHLTMNELVEEIATLVIVLYGLHVHSWADPAPQQRRAA
jgi:hypothetical protein